MFKSPVEYTADRFEFHYPSEHTVNNVQYDFEMQIYHKVKWQSLEREALARQAELEEQ